MFKCELRANRCQGVDENIAAAVIDQLAEKDVDIRRVSHVLPEGTLDPDVLAYAHENGYALLTHDEQIIGLIATRHREGIGHAGVFIAGHHLQGGRGIGTIVTCILDFHELIAGGAGTVQDDVYNQSIYISGNKMVLEIREHIKLRGNNPLEAMITGTHHKAYLVANLALNDGPQAAAEHYRIPLATVHGAMAFYYYNEAAIHEAIQEARKLGEQLGARSAQSALEKRGT